MNGCCCCCSANYGRLWFVGLTNCNPWGRKAREHEQQQLASSLAGNKGKYLSFEARADRSAANSRNLAELCSSLTSRSRICMRTQTMIHLRASSRPSAGRPASYVSRGASISALVASRCGQRSVVRSRRSAAAGASLRAARVALRPPVRLAPERQVAYN